MAKHHLQPARYYYTFAPHEPALRVRSGDTVTAETRDAMGGDASGNPLPEELKHRPPGTELNESNPVVGPIVVEEAEPRDLLAVQVRRIALSRDFALSKQGGHFGSLTGESAGYHLLYNPPVSTVHYRWRLDLERQVGVLELRDSRLARVEAPLAPFIGSIGVAPRFGRVETTLTPGEFGGNMDCAEVREGATLYLPVWVKGAYLSFGDVHALQGDGEINGTALEVTADVTLGLELVRGKAADWPRLENETHIMVIASARPLMDAIRLAQIELLRWLVAEHGFQREEAWQIMAQVGSMRVANVVDPRYTVAARFPKRYLP